MIKVEFQINRKIMDYLIVQFLELTSYLVNHETVSLFLHQNKFWVDQ